MDIKEKGKEIAKALKLDLDQAPPEVLDILQQLAEKIIQSENAGRAALREELDQMLDEELMIYVPDVYQKDIYRIDYRKLRENGIMLLSFDIDDTIADCVANTAIGTKFTMPAAAKHLFQNLKEMGFIVTLLTNAHLKVAKDACEALQADDFIEKAAKPETRNFEVLMERYGLQPSQMAHIGNSMRDDIRGGNRAGVTTCLVRRAGVATKFGEYFLHGAGLPTKSHIIREKLLERGIWRKHHKNDKNDQYYQLGEQPSYKCDDQGGLHYYRDDIALGESRYEIYGGNAAMEHEEQSPTGKAKTPIWVVYDGESSYEAANNLYKYIVSLGYEARLLSADHYTKGRSGKVIVVGHHSLAKDWFEYTGMQYDSYGMGCGMTGNICVLTASRSALGNGKSGRNRFAEYYNQEILSYNDMVTKYNVPLRFGYRNRTKESQYDLLWLKFAMYGLPEFLNPGDTPLGGFGQDNN